jgi:hypothetical protein
MLRPTDRARSLAQAYMRHLCREQGAASVELIRCSREAITPMLVFLLAQATQEHERQQAKAGGLPVPFEPPAMLKRSLSVMKAHFGEYRCEK